jgi:hypothetical protein
LAHFFHRILVITVACLAAVLPGYGANLSIAHEQIAKDNHTALELYRQHDYSGAENLLKNAIDRAHELESGDWLGTLMANLSAVYAAQGKTNDSKRLAIEADAIKHPGFRPSNIPQKPAPLEGYLNETFHLSPVVENSSPKVQAKPELKAIEPRLDASLILPPGRVTTSRRTVRLSDSYYAHVPPRHRLFSPFPHHSSYQRPERKPNDCHCSVIRLTYYQLMLMGSGSAPQISNFSFEQASQLFGF